MLSWIGLWEILLVLGLLLLFFGGRRIPRIARGLGSGIRNLKGEIARDEREDPERGAGGAADSDRTGGSDDGPGPAPTGGSPRPS